jgi:hypothetical protein
LPSVAGLGGWALIVLGLFCAFVVLPPYPYILTAIGDPEFRLQFFVGLLALVGVVVVLYLPTELNALLQIGLSVAAVVVALPALLALRPAAEAVLAARWPLGLGLPLLLAGLAVLALSGLRRLFGQRT